MLLIFWASFASFAVAETFIVFWVPLYSDSPPICARHSSKSRRRAILTHCLILTVYLVVVGFLTWQESHFGWLSRGNVFTRALGLLISAFVTASIERELFFRDSGTHPNDDTRVSDT